MAAAGRRATTTRTMATGNDDNDNIVALDRSRILLDERFGVHADPRRSGNDDDDGNDDNEDNYDYKMGDLSSLAVSFGDGVGADAADTRRHIMAISNGMCLTRFAHLDLKFPIFLSQYACCDFLSQYAYCDVQYACSTICILRCNIDCFLLNQKDLESMSILPKKICNMHIASRNMHIAIESILPLTLRCCLALTPCPNNTAPPKLFG
jgi:hypothetical protein